MSYWQDFAIAAIGLSTLVRLYLRHRGAIAGRTVADEQPITLDLNQDRYTFYTPNVQPVYTAAQAAELDPETLAALWYAEELRHDELPGIATRLLERGFDTPFLRRVAGEQPSRRAEISDSAEKMFDELQAGDTRTRKQALKLLSLAIAIEVRLRTRKPADAVLVISSLYDWQPRDPITAIILLNYAYEHHLEENPVASFVELDAQARTAFAELERNLTPPV